MNYFDHEDNDDKALLLQGHRGHSDLATVTTIAEFDVIDHYTERAPEILYTSRLGRMTQDGLITGSTGRYEDVTSQGLAGSSTRPERRVYLLGYKADAAHADVDPALRLALKRTIADVINWRLSLLAREPALTSASDGIGKSRSYAANSQDDLPPMWNKRLIPYDSREGVDGL